MQHTTGATLALVATLSVALLAAPASAATGRRALQQNDALSNSNGCLPTIPKCESGACATRNVMGNARWVCLRCLTNYAPVVDTSGQDNIVQCVCPRGTFENGTNAGSCTPCPANSYCPGGDNVENPTSRGTNFTCGTNLVTRTTSARSLVDCVAPAGYALAGPGSAAPCNPSEYAPQFNRLAKCLRCQSGLAEPPSSGLTFSDRASKRVVCKIPPGRYVSQGLVRICPQGFYRENWVEFDAAVGTICLPCNAGITTDGAGAGLASYCNKTLPGYGISPVYNVTSPASIPALPATTTTGLPNATLCDIGFYSLGGYCAQCPTGTVTTVKGAKSIEECVVPPGYFLPGGGINMTSCGNGTFREGWVMYSDPKAANCTLCGDGIWSEARDLDQNPRVAANSTTRATSASCYIESGMGMIAQGKNLFVGQDCPINTYGAAGKVYGWAAAPCKPCPRNMITDGATRVNNSDVCINDDGFGYASEGASRCAPGFYSAKGSRRPCQQCPIGRNTTWVPAQQRNLTDCFVRPGFGVVNSTANATDAFNLNLTSLDNTTLSLLPVLECPVGYYGAGNSAGAKCTACPAGSSTQAPGSQQVSDCNVCLPGWGKNTSSDPCTPCPYGTYQPGGDTVCRACDPSTFYGPVDGQSGGNYTSSGTTLYQGTIGLEGCVPRQSQLSPEAGQAYFAPGADVAAAFATTNNTANLTACLAVCAAVPAKACMAQWDAVAKVCRTATLDPASSTATSGSQLLYKLPPSTLGSASSLDVKGKMMSSGFYAVASIANTTLWSTAGSNLGADARTFATGAAQWDNGGTNNSGTGISRPDCKKKCDNSNVCWGFLFTPNTGASAGAGALGSCLYRGGVDALGTRAFFALPDSSTAGVAALWW